MLLYYSWMLTQCMNQSVILHNIHYFYPLFTMEHFLSGSLAMGKHLIQALPSVYALQCLTGKEDKNKKNKKNQHLSLLCPACPSQVMF